MGNFEDLSVGGFDELKPSLRNDSLPVAQFTDDGFDLADFVLGAFARVDVIVLNSVLQFPFN